MVRNAKIRLVDRNWKVSEKVEELNRGGALDYDFREIFEFNDTRCGKKK